MTAYTQLLELNLGEQIGDRGKEFVRYIVEASTRMHNLLRDLRVYLQVSTTVYEPVEEIDAGEIVEKALQNLNAAISESGASVTFAGLPRVRMPAFELEHVFQNLIANAIRYRSSAPPRVNIAASRQGEEWVFSIQDNGIGIAPQFQKQIFDIFRRLHSESEYPGTGMGLAICQRSLERYGGQNLGRI